jgi:hypothetical protein
MRALIVGLVSLAGVGLGWDTAAATHPTKTHVAPPLTPIEIVSLRHDSRLVSVPMAQSAALEQRQARELARLETRNRRLEALVCVLRNRQRESQH